MFLSYVALGIAVAMPIGAISIEMTKQGLKNGFMHSWMIGLGSVTIDILLLVALNLGLADILNSVQTYLWLLGSVFLTFLGVQSIKSSSISNQEGEVKKEPLLKGFRRGVLIGVNPGNIIFWVSVLGTSIAGASATAEMSLWVISIAILIGIMFHDFLLALLTSSFKRFMTEKTNRWVSVIAGVLLIGFALYFFKNFIVSII